MGFYVFYTFLCDTGTSSELFYAFIKDLEDVAKEKFVRIKAGVKYTSSVQTFIYNRNFNIQKVHLAFRKTQLKNTN